MALNEFRNLELLPFEGAMGRVAGRTDDGFLLTTDTQIIDCRALLSVDSVQGSGKKKSSARGDDV